MSELPVPLVASSWFELAFSNEMGVRRQEPLSSCWHVPFERMAPSRAFPSFKGQKNFTGLWWSATMRRHVGYESWVERAVAMMLDFDSDVVEFSSQPFELRWEAAQGERRHTPDYFARLADGTGVVVDVRPDDLIAPEDAEAFGATAQACAEVGWVFRRTGGPSPVLAANVRWLAGYRRAHCMREDVADELMGVFADPTSLIFGVETVGDRLAVLPVLFHLLWGRRLAVANLGLELLGPRSMVQVCDGSVEMDENASRGPQEPGAMQPSQDEQVTVRSPVLAAGLLGGLPDEVIQEAKWWETQVLEVMTGLPPGAPAGSRPRPGYEATRSLRERERAKEEELLGLGREGVSAGTVKRKRLRYEAEGLLGLVDGRVDRARPTEGRTDPRVLEALKKAIREATDKSTRTASWFRWRVDQILREEHGADVVAMPSRATFYRLFERLSRGSHATGSARTRRSLANRPEGMFGEVTASRPGEIVEIDSTPFDVMVLLDKGVPGRVELTGMVDLATRSVPAAVLRPTTKSVDASLLLAKTMTPEAMRPGWVEALAMARSVLPHRRMLALDERLEHAAARPVIVPEMIVCDRGSVYISANFRTSCHVLGIDFQPAHQDTPTDKPHIERTLESVSTLFAQFVSGYLGRSTEYRGRKVEEEPLWSMVELQALLDEWIVAEWQNRPHDKLRDPSAPGRAFTPNERYAALVETSGYVPVALSADDYIELLPSRWQAINAYGVKIDHRTYDDEALNPFRRQASGVVA